jgi:hypothetical protein
MKKTIHRKKYRLLIIYSNTLTVKSAFNKRIKPAHLLCAGFFMPIRHSGFIDLIQAIYLQQSLHDIYQ